MFANATAGNMSDLPFEDELDFPDFLLLEDAALLLLEDVTLLLELLATVLLLLDLALLLDDDSVFTLELPGLAEELLESTFLLELLDATVPELELDSGGLLPTDISSAASSKTG